MSIAFLSNWLLRCEVQRSLYAANSRDRLTAARGADEIVAITSAIMAEGGARNNCDVAPHPNGRHNKHNNAHGRAHAKRRKTRARFGLGGCNADGRPRR